MIVIGLVIVLLMIGIVLGRWMSYMLTLYALALRGTKCLKINGFTATDTFGVACNRRKYIRAI